MTTEAQDRRLYYQVYHLPARLERARARVRQLEAEARRYGMHELVPPPEAATAGRRECEAAPVQRGEPF